MSPGEGQYSTKLVWIGLSLILLWGGTLRFYSLGTQSIWIDESFSALAAEKIAASGSPLLDSGRYYGRSKPHTYLRALTIKVLGKSSFALRFPTAIFGTVMILLAAVSCRVFYGRWLPGIVAALLVSCNYYEVAWSRQVRMYMEFQFFFSLTLLLLFICTVKRKNSIPVFFTLLLCSILTLMLHKSSVLIVIPAVFMVICYRKNISGKAKVATGLLIAVAIIYYLAGYEGNWNMISATSVKQLFDPPRLPVQFVHYTNFLLYNHTLVCVGFLLCILFLFKSRNRADIVFIVTFLAILILVSSRSGILMRSLFVAYPFLFYAASHGLVQAGESVAEIICRKGTFEKYASARSSFVLGLTIMGILVTSIINDQHVVLPREKYFLEYDPTYTGLNTWDYTPQPDFNAAYSYIREHGSKDDVYIVAHTALHNWYMTGSRTYWLGFLFLADPKRVNFVHVTKNRDKIDGYMGYPSITTREDMKRIFSNHHGFVIIDYYSMSTRTPPGYVKYLLEQAPVVFHDDAHPEKPWTRVWVGRF